MSSSRMFQAAGAIQIVNKSRNPGVDMKVKRVIDGVEVEAKLHHPLKGKKEGDGRDPYNTLTPFWKDKKKQFIDSLAKDSKGWYICSENGCAQVCQARSAIHRHIRDACKVRNARLQMLGFKLKTFDPEDDVAGPLGPQPVPGSELVNKFKTNTESKAKGSKINEAVGDSNKGNASVQTPASASAVAPVSTQGRKRTRETAFEDEGSPARVERKTRKIATRKSAAIAPKKSTEKSIGMALPATGVPTVETATGPVALNFKNADVGEHGYYMDDLALSNPGPTYTNDTSDEDLAFGLLLQAEIERMSEYPDPTTESSGFTSPYFL